MNLKEYEQASSRTFAYRKSNLSIGETDWLHCAIGISTEAAELLEAFTKDDDNLDTVNIGEEIADQMWYLSNLIRFINADIGRHFFSTNISTEKTLSFYVTNSVKLAGELMDIFKRHIYYGKELSIEVLTEKLKDIYTNLHFISDAMDLNFNKLLDNNIAKLKIRFPDRFTQENAINRNFEAERKELEK